MGSVDEKQGEKGIAHTLEHLLFQGSKKYSAKKYNFGIESKGISTNAFTSFDSTGYYYDLPPEHLEWIIKVEADRMGWPLLSKKYLKKEKLVVLEEKRQRANSPTSRLFKYSMKMLFKNHPYEHPIIGYTQDIQNYTQQQVRDFFYKHYVPSNAVLVLAGDFDEAQAKTWIQTHYEKIPSGTVKRSPPPALSPQKKTRTQQFKEPTQTTHLYIAFQGPEMGAPDGYALDILADILGGGSYSRLYKKLVYSHPLSTGVSTYLMSLKTEGAFTIHTGLYPHVKPQKVLGLIKEELKKLQTHLVQEEEMERAKTFIIKGTVDQLATLRGRANLLAHWELFFGDYQKMSEELNLYKKVTAQDIFDVAKKYLSPHQMNISTLSPPPSPNPATTKSSATGKKTPQKGSSTTTNK